MWTERESNPRHKDFQSFALPTELSVLKLEAKYTNKYFFFKRKNKITGAHGYAHRTSSYRLCLIAYNINAFDDSSEHCFFSKHFKHVI